MRAEIEVVDNAARWTANILTELLANYGEMLDKDVGKDSRATLREAVRSLSHLQNVIRHARTQEAYNSRLMS